jgi:hypothetical protein
MPWMHGSWLFVAILSLGHPKIAVAQPVDCLGSIVVRDRSVKLTDSSSLSFS